MGLMTLANVMYSAFGVDMGSIITEANCLSGKSNTGEQSKTSVLLRSIKTIFAVNPAKQRFV